MDDATSPAPAAAGERPFGPDAAAILATEHWSLLGTRSILWQERISRTTLFLTVLSAAVVALALLTDATGFGPQARTLALVLLPIVLLLGLATFMRLVQITTEDTRLVLAMNRLRHGYLAMAPALAPFFSTGHHDDEHGLAATHLLLGPDHVHAGSRELQPWLHFLLTTPTIVATIDTCLATVIAVLVLQALGAAQAVLVVGGCVVFAVVWGGLFSLHRSNLGVLHPLSPRFPMPREP